MIGEEDGLTAGEVVAVLEVIAAARDVVTARRAGHLPELELKRLDAALALLKHQNERATTDGQRESPPNSTRPSGGGPRPTVWTYLLGLAASSKHDAGAPRLC